MPVFKTHREFKKDINYDTLANSRMTEANSIKARGLLSTNSRNTVSKSEARILTKENVEEQIKFHIAPLTRHPKDMTRLIQGMPSVYQQNLSQCASTKNLFSEIFFDWP